MFIANFLDPGLPLTAPAVFAADPLAAALATTGWQGPDWLGPAGNWLTALALVFLCAVAWLTNLFMIPGNWIAVALLALYAWLGPDEGRLDAGWVGVTVAFALALLGELVEFVAGAAGATRAGASRRATLYAVVGSIAGACLGAVVGTPVPIIGSLLAAVLFGGLGATAGAMYGEWAGGRELQHSWRIGRAAFIGRTLGTLGKSTIGIGIVIVALLVVVI